MFIAAIFTIAKIWKQLKCLSTDEWYIYNGIFSHEKEENLQFGTTWMDIEGIMLSDISQTKKDKYCMISLLCGL